MTPIQNAHRLTSIFGTWPSFHDAEVLKLELDRTEPSITLQLFAFQTTSTTDSEGYYKRIHECIVTFRFHSVEDVSLEGFNHQNVVAGISFERRARVDVLIEPLHGIAGSFSCSSAEVVDVKSIGGPS